jgi:hypothetical protein
MNFAFMQKALHDGHVEPFVEFSADLAFDPDQGEAHLFVQCDGPK